jgi:c-di-GMP-binding flagellar brake protein YcgR
MKLDPKLADTSFMGVASEMPPIPTVYKGQNARRNPRIRCISTNCSLGEVLDISASGARLRWRGKMRLEAGEAIELEIDGIDSTFSVAGTIKWVASVGWRRSEMGVEFVKLAPEKREELVKIVRETVGVRNSSFQKREHC